MGSNSDGAQTPETPIEVSTLRSIKTNTYKSFVEQVGKNISLFLIAGLAFGAYLLHEKYLIYITEEVSHRQLSSLRSVVSEPEKKFIASAKTLTEAYAILLNHNQSLSTDIQRINDAFHKTMIDNTDRIMSKFAKEIDIVHNISIRHQDIIDQFQQEKSKARNLSSSNEKSTADNIFVETENNTVTAPIIDQLFYADVDVNNIIVTFQSNELIEIKLCLNSFCKKIINPNFDSPINDVLRKYHRSGIAGGGFELETAGRSSASKNLHHIKISVLRYDISDRIQRNEFALEGFILVGRTKEHEQR